MHTVGLTPFGVDMVESDSTGSDEFYRGVSQQRFVATCPSAHEQPVGIAQVSFRYLFSREIAAIKMGLQTPVEKRYGVVNDKFRFQVCRF